MLSVHRRTLPVLAIRLCALLLLFAALPSIVAAGGYPPQATIVSADGTFANDFDCSFPLQEQVSGSFRDTLYFDQNGVLAREFISPQFEGALTVSWTNPATGASLSSHEASSLIIYYNPDGSFRKLENAGLTFHVSVPGAGQLLLDVGRVVIQRGQGITFLAGPHQELLGDTTAFCAYLAH